MAEPAAARGDTRRPLAIVPPAPEPRPEGADRFAELRSLIVGPEQRELHALQEHLLDQAVQTRQVSSVLPDAIALRANDPQLTRALAPSVEEAITASVRRDPRPLADALFPVIGPAIRKAIAHTLASMVETVNRTVEHSISWRALQWRWTALRTGKPFAEIVLLNTLQYRVEQVFLIHAESGLLLQHVSADGAAEKDADQVSAMLTAIGDFVRDSFKVGGGDSLDALRVGELAVLVEQGPHAVLAGVVRGTPPIDLRRMFEDALETVHRQFSPELRAFNGDAAALERVRPVLEACLVTQYRMAQKTGSWRLWVIGAAAALLALAAWGFLGYRERQRWNGYLDRLRAEPGVVVVSSTTRGGKHVITGLRDPLSVDPASLLAGSDIDAASVESRWEPYQALHSPFVMARASDLLRPPPGMTLTYRDGVLEASGAASDRWVAESERLAPAIAGVRRFVYDGVAADIRLKEQIEGSTLLFERGLSTLLPGQEQNLRSLARAFRDLNEALRVRGRRGSVEVIGHTDSDGSDTLNDPLSRARADAALALFQTPLIDALDFKATGVGSTQPASSGRADADKNHNRRAAFRVELTPDPRQPIGAR